MYFRAFPAILREEMTVQECLRRRTLGMNMLSASNEHRVDDAEDKLKREHNIPREVVM
jgi:hypothetical protein